jgi:hypothetical protein
VDVEIRDLAGNVSDVLSTSIRLDRKAPSVWSVTVNDGRPYVHPNEGLEFEVLAGDVTGGAGVTEFKVGFVEGEWTGWYPVNTGPVAVERPDAVGSITAAVVARDGVGNESSAFDAGFYLLEQEPTAPGPGAKFAGEIAEAVDVDALRIDLVEADILSVTLKAKSAEKKKKLALALDLVGPDGDFLVIGRYPADGRKVEIKGLEAPKTGSYLVVVRRDEESEAGLGTYTLRLQVKQAKTNKTRSGQTTETTIAFEAMNGSTLKGKLQGDGLTLSKLTLVGPEGGVDFVAREKKGRITLRPTVLTAGTGTYEFRLEGVSGVDYRLGVKLPKKPKGIVRE